MARTILSVLTRFNGRMCDGFNRVAGAFLMVMTAIVMSQVFSRYLLNDSLMWTEEVAKTMMVWIAFLTAPWAYRSGANVGIEIFVEQLPKRFRAMLRVALDLLVMWIIVVFLIEGFGFMLRGDTLWAMSLPIRMSWFYAIVPIGFCAMLCVSLEIVLRDILSVIYPDEGFQIEKHALVEAD